MNDIILFLSAFVIGYIAFMLVTIFLIRLFFPFSTEDEIVNINTTISLEKGSGVNRK